MKKEISLKTSFGKQVEVAALFLYHIALRE